MKILLTDASLCSTLAVTRSLGRRGLDVVVAESKRWAMSFFSKYTKEFFFYPSNQKEPQKFVKTLASEAKRRRCSLVIPMSDVSLLLVSMHREMFEGTLVPLPPHSVIKTILNKREVLKKAEKLRMPIPKEFKPEDAPLPCVIKSAYACYFDGREIKRLPPFFLNDRKELLRIYEEFDAKIPNPLLQEYIEGVGCGVFLLLDKEGGVRAAFMHRRVKEIDPKGSASCVCESIKKDEVLIEWSKNLLKALNWWGPAMVEYRVKDGVPYLMEVNARFWGSLPLSIAAGVDFPWLHIRLLRGEDFYLDDYKVGERARYLRGEILHLLMVAKGHPWLPYPGKAESVCNFLKEFLINKNYYNLSITDPFPGLVDLFCFLIEDLPSLLRRRFAI